MGTYSFRCAAGAPVEVRERHRQGKIGTGPTARRWPKYTNGSWSGITLYGSIRQSKALSP
ncbi:MAG: hypothetical protein OHK0015_42520 [Chloroflexi bacterium OHK40]